MLGNFTYHNPTKLIFGKDAMQALATELAAYGPTVQLVYGSGSIKKNGIYDQVISALAAAGKTVVEDAGVMPNPTVVRARARSRLRHAVHDARVRRPAARLRAGALAVEPYQHLRSIMPWTEHGSSTEGFRQTGEEGKKREKKGKLAKQVKEPENWRTRMNRLFKSLEKYDIGLLITIDEIRVTLDEMIAFASTYQLFVREGKRVGLLMAGLPQQVSALLRDESVSFLRRCVQHRLDSIANQEVADALRRTIESEGRTVETPELQRMVEAIGGFPFMMQLVGYRVWYQSPCEQEISENDVDRGIELACSDMEQRVLAPTYRELSEQDVQFLEAMLPDGGGVSFISNVAERMGVSSNYASKYRARLIEQGVVGERGRGRIGFDMPFFREYVEKMREA